MDAQQAPSRQALTQIPVNCGKAPSVRGKQHTRLSTGASSDSVGDFGSASGPSSDVAAADERKAATCQKAG